jgi:flagellar biosynthesis/type III secretory pathway protein FliH
MQTNDQHENMKYEKWQVPAITDADDLLTTMLKIKQLREEAQHVGAQVGEREGHALGYAAGLASASVEIAQLQQDMTYCLELLTQPLAMVDQEVEQAMVCIIQVLAKHLLQREIARSPDILLDIVRQAKNLLVSDSPCVIRVNPDDWQRICRAKFKLAEDDCQFIADPAISTGSCYLHNAFEHIHVDLEQRISAMLHKTLGSKV